MGPLRSCAGVRYQARPKHPRRPSLSPPLSPGPHYPKSQIISCSVKISPGTLLGKKMVPSSGGGTLLGRFFFLLLFIFSFKKGGVHYSVAKIAPPPQKGCFIGGVFYSGQPSSVVDPPPLVPFPSGTGPSALSQHPPPSRPPPPRSTSACSSTAPPPTPRCSSNASGAPVRGNVGPTPHPNRPPAPPPPPGTHGTHGGGLSVRGGG